MAVAVTILSEEHYKALQDCLKSCAITQEVIEKGRRAGIDIGPADDENKRQAAMAAGIKREFFPDLP